MANRTVSLKLLVDRSTQRVLFAEAGKDFVDFLFSLLILPVGTVIRLLTKGNMVGSLGNLYDSIEAFKDTYLEPNTDKSSLLNPKAPILGANDVALLLPNVAASNFYRCSNNNSVNCRAYMSDSPNAVCPQCKQRMTIQAKYVNAQGGTVGSTSSNGGGYVKSAVTYMVLDNLVVKPMSTISGIALLNKFKVKDLGALEEVEMDIGIEEGVKLLKASLQSTTVLSDVLLVKVQAEEAETERPISISL